MRAAGTIYVQAAPDGTFIARVAELPGCFARGGSRDDAVAKVKASFHDLVAVFERRGVSVDHWKALDPETFAVKEPATPQFLDEDAAPLQEHELRDFLHHLEAIRSSLLSLVREISPTDMERAPTPSGWSVRQALEHVMTTEVALLSRLEKWPEHELATLQAVHRLASQRFTVMEPDDFVDHEINGIRWTTRKVMRRILEHEFEHIAHIKEILAERSGYRAPE